MSIYGNLLTEDIRAAINESFEALNEVVKLIGTKSDYGMYPNTNKMIEGVNICIQYDDLAEEEMKEQLDHLDKDFSVVKRSYKNFLNGKFKEWLKISDSEFKTLKIYEICYKYSGSTVDGTKKGEKYSHFEFCYQYNYDDSKGTCPVAMELVVVNGKVLKSYFTDI